MDVRLCLVPHINGQRTTVRHMLSMADLYQFFQILSLKITSKTFSKSFIEVVCLLRYYHNDVDVFRKIKKLRKKAKCKDFVKTQQAEFFLLKNLIQVVEYRLIKRKQPP